MTRSVGGGLARVTVASPLRRVDVALPDAVPVAELLPALLRNAGEGLADDGQAHGGWVLRRVDGQLVDPARSLAAQELRDGEVLHLVARQDDWPELDYDDVVDAIAGSARAASPDWGPAATRRTGVAVACAALLLALGLAGTGPDHALAGVVALCLALVALGGGVVLARLASDAEAGTALAVVAMVAAAVGGGLVGLGEQPLSALGPAQVLTAAVALVLVSLVGVVAVAGRTQYPVGGVVVGVLGVVAALLARAGSVDGTDAAAVVAVLVVVLAPLAPLLSLRLGKLPVPALPSTTEDLLADPPPVGRARVEARVRRTDELLTGMLGGGAAAAVLATPVLLTSGRTSALWLVGLVAAVSLLRARFFPAARHRVPLLLGGLLPALALGVAAGGLPEPWVAAGAVPALVVVAGLAVAAGLVFRHRAPGPYVGRVADVLDVVLVLAVVPVACAVLGLYGYVRGLYG
ncbi:type VII secretion integral membrane protein EccD [Klenkia sp. PcliD-1-E]|uniref:type VII secretion integral membrane protein EccD n=1 Tax=Klenkia sp. PcliD-1-E TaxID=2954492 RepID=UPI0020980B8B|nr:type VII secretion integral membrane protein EccD [Klenkia sp. PcliD-1-E]MCO7222088.1 type VII secretion integral membrane protein EccD [Klenkia sp. PcliD-1-E]